MEILATGGLAIAVVVAGLIVSSRRKAGNARVALTR
jgi:GABA permease